MDREWWIGSAATAFMGLSLGATGVALYDGVIRYPQWERAREEPETYKKDYSAQPLTQMEPSWQLYLVGSICGALAGSGAFAFANRRRREPQAGGLVRRINPLTQ